MSTLTEQILTAIAILKVPKSPKGVSRQAIHKAVGEGHTAAQFNLALQRAVENKKIIQIKGSYKIAEAAKPKVALLLAGISRLIAVRCPNPRRSPPRLLLPSRPPPKPPRQRRPLLPRSPRLPSPRPPPQVPTRIHSFIL